jgi:hypothetical protein
VCCASSRRQHTSKCGCRQQLVHWCNQPFLDLAKQAHSSRCSSWGQLHVRSAATAAAAAQARSVVQCSTAAASQWLLGLSNLGGRHSSSCV